MQRELLEKNPEAEVRVLAVWFNMLESDARARWPEELLSDPRVLHFWDEEKRVGRFYLDHFELADEDYHAEALWDAYILYGAEGRWASGPPEPISWGYTIVRSRGRLERDFRKLLEQAAPTQ